MRREYLKHKESARELVHARLAYWKTVYPFVFGQVRIKNHRRAWGSCSSKRNLNFNWRLVHLSPELSDYVIVHELCHTVHLNHSPAFWGLVNHLMPTWREHRFQLRTIAIGVQ
jgi:predicted metal-dependent hydrolase